MTKAKRIAARANPLAEDFGGFPVDGSERYVEHRCPNEAFAPGDVTAGTWNANVNRGGYSLALWVNTGHGSVALVQGPDGDRRR